VGYGLQGDLCIFQRGRYLMIQTIVFIGGDGVGKSMLGRVLMELELSHKVLIAEPDRVMQVDGDVSCSVEIALPDCLKEPDEIRHLSRRNKSDRKRNRADRWR
jgi:ABC-type oligopeptide transport system ATPase subunit